MSKVSALSTGRSKDALFKPWETRPMGDSFFWAAMRDSKMGNVAPRARMYVGVARRATYGSVLTTQVRTFSTALFPGHCVLPRRRHRDAWWTTARFTTHPLSLEGAQDLFDYGYTIENQVPVQSRRVCAGRSDVLKVVEELPARLTHPHRQR